VWGHHHPRFDIDEAALPTGIEMFVRLVERYLS
jgi:amidohydrolase